MYPKINLALFFTRGVSLQTWAKGGMLDREVVLYQQLQKRGIEVTFVTYGGKEDIVLAKKLPGIHLICNKNKWEESQYIKWLTSPWTWFRHKPHIIKSNQFFGAEVALAVSQRIGTRFIARAGYIPSINMANQEGQGSSLSQAAIKIEREVIPMADQVVVATSSMKDILINKDISLSGKIKIIPNYVVTDIFKPAEGINLIPGNRLCFIGRLEKEKNLFSLLEALINLDVELYIIGGGSQQVQLESYAMEKQLRVNFLGNLPNSRLPEIIRLAKVYIQPSLYEGHPKTIIEAMACGAAVIAGDSPGIRELIIHRRNGFLCAVTPDGIRSALQEVLADEQLRIDMGKAARQFAVENYSLDKVVEMELDLYHQLFAEKRH